MVCLMWGVHLSETTGNSQSVGVVGGGGGDEVGATPAWRARLPAHTDGGGTPPGLQPSYLSGLHVSLRWPYGSILGLAQCAPSPRAV